MSNEIFKKNLNDFYSAVSLIQFYQRLIKKNIKKELIESHDTLNNLSNIDDEDIKTLHGQSIDAFFFYNPITGHIQPYECKRTLINEKENIIHFHKNKQYQWLLAEAYELFEDYVESLYACCGYTDKSFWQLADYGTISIDEIDGKDYSWFLKRARDRKGGIKEILAQFRKKIPELENIEKNNSTGLNLRLSISLIENLRHIIVHKNGMVTSKDNFIKKVLSESGLTNNNDAKNVINSFFGQNEYENLIVLLEQFMLNSPAISIETNRHEHLVGDLIGYTYLLHKLVVEKFFPIEE